MDTRAPHRRSRRIPEQAVSRRTPTSAQKRAARNSPAPKPDAELLQALAEERAARAQAEAAERRFAFLAEVSHLLSASLDLHETFASLARLVVPELADACLIDVFDEEGRVRRVEAVHRDPARQELMRRLQRHQPYVGAPHGVGRVLRTGEPSLLPEIDDETLDGSVRGDEHLRLLGEIGVRSAAVVPMLSRGRVLGSIALLLTDGERRYGAADLAIAEELGHRAALAVDNARLYEQAQEAIRHRDESMAALRGLNQTLETLVQACPLAVMLLDPDDATVLLWNPAAERIFGWKEHEVLGQPLPVVPPDRGEEFRRHTAAILHGAMPQGIETVRQRKGGERIQVSLWTSTVPDGQGGVRLLALVADVTARKQIETALRKSDARLRDLMDTAAEGVWILDAEHRTTYVNRRAAEMLQRPMHEILGRSADAFFAPSTLAEVDEVWASCRRGLRERRELCFLLPDGSELWASTSVSPVLDESGEFNGVLAMLDDITERRRLDEELRRRVEELAAADRRKDEFLAMLAHELRNPLAAISNAGQALDQLRGQLHGPSRDQGRGEDARAGELVAVIARQIRHLSRLVDDLLDVSRFTRGKIELRRRRAELRPIVEGAVETTLPLIERHQHRLTVSLPPEPIWLEADTTRIEQVVANLLNNAAKFTDPRGNIALTAERDGDEVVLTVRDDGQGIAADLLPRIFDLFVQEDRSLARSHGGLGIGLTLVRSLVERHGGTVRARSDGPGRGTEITVRLPRLAGEEEREAAAEWPALPASPPQAPARVLLVEDNVDAADALAELLRLWGHEVAVAHDGAAAVQMAQTLAPGVVLLDIGLPGMDGYQVASVLRSLPDLQRALIVALTGYGQEADRQRSSLAGFDHHLVKPVDLEVLRRLVSSGRAIGADEHLKRGSKARGHQAEVLQESLGLDP